MKQTPVLLKRHIQCIGLCILLLLHLSSTVENFVDQDLGAADVVWFVVSQPTPYHVQKAQGWRDSLRDGPWSTLTSEEEKERMKIYLAHEDFPNDASWTYFPVLERLYEENRKAKWFFFCEDRTTVKLDPLLNILKPYDSSQTLFLGRALRDRQHAITHHYMDPELMQYPDPMAGFFISRALMASLVSQLTSLSSDLNFSIDPKHELAKAIWKEGTGMSLTDVQELCAGDHRDAACVTFPTSLDSCTDFKVTEDDLYFGIKTCSKFHQDRVAVVQKTWGDYAKHKEFYSDVADDSIPTRDSGVPNTERGHCGKMYAILKRFSEDEDLSSFPWLVICDDDTILSPSRIQDIVSCYDSSTPVVVGERYGYRVVAGGGSAYPTGGSGMLLSRPAVAAILECPSCVCPSDDSFDDMFLGMWISRVGIPLVHSPSLHQSTPGDYAESLLMHQHPASFHKHFMIDPLEVYGTWFADADKEAKASWQTPGKRPVGTKASEAATVHAALADEAETLTDNSSGGNSTEDNSSEDKSTEDNSSEDNSTEDNSSEDNSRGDDSREDESDPEELEQDEETTAREPGSDDAPSLVEDTQFLSTQTEEDPNEIRVGRERKDTVTIMDKDRMQETNLVEEAHSDRVKDEF